MEEDRILARAEFSPIFKPREVSKDVQSANPFATSRPIRIDQFIEKEDEDCPDFVKKIYQERLQRNKTKEVGKNEAKSEPIFSIEKSYFKSKTNRIDSSNFSSPFVEIRPIKHKSQASNHPTEVFSLFNNNDKLISKSDHVKNKNENSKNVKKEKNEIEICNYKQKPGCCICKIFI